MTDLPRVTIEELRTHTADVIGRVLYNNEQIIVTRYGHDAVVLLSIRDYDRLTEGREYVAPPKRPKWNKMPIQSFNTTRTINSEATQITVAYGTHVCMHILGERYGYRVATVKSHHRLVIGRNEPTGKKAADQITITLRRDGLWRALGTSHRSARHFTIEPAYVIDFRKPVTPNLSKQVSQ